MAKKVKKPVEEVEDLRPDDFPPPPLSKDGKGKGPLETLSPTNTIITGMVVILVGAVAAGTPWLFLNGESVPAYMSVGALLAVLGLFLIFVGYKKEEWRKAVKEWLKSYRGGKLADLKLPEWLEIEETRSSIPVLPPDGVIPESPKLNQHNVEATHMALPDLSSMVMFPEADAPIREDVEEDPAELFADEPEPNFEQFWNEDDDYEDYPPVAKHSQEEENLPQIPQRAFPEEPSLRLPAMAPEAQPQKDFLDDFFDEEDAQEAPLPLPATEAFPGALETVDTCTVCGHSKGAHSSSAGTCAACLMSDDDNLVCEAFTEKSWE